ncbi:hypothetical protein ACVWZ6_007039 [Bradyrhizobium sp. GM6.1]
MGQKVHHPIRPLSSSAEAVGRLGGSILRNARISLLVRWRSLLRSSTFQQQPDRAGHQKYGRDRHQPMRELDNGRIYHLISLTFAISTLGEALSEKSMRLLVPFLEAPEQKRGAIAWQHIAHLRRFVSWRRRRNLEASRRHNCAKNPSEARSMASWSRRNARSIGAALLVSLVVIGPACSNSAKSRAERPRARATFLAVEDLPRRPPPMTPEERAKILQELAALRHRQKAVAPNSN